MHLRSSGAVGVNLLLVLYFGAAFVALVAMRVRGRTWGEIWGALGWRGCAPTWFALGLAIAVGTGIAAAVAFALLDPGFLRHPTPGSDQYRYARMGLSLGAVAEAFALEAFNQTLGEEVFFRGLLGGWLTSRLGFQAGNAVQAVLFLLPHLTLLLLSSRFWPILILQLAGGWLLGWLRVRSGSILPGWLSHTVINTLSDVMFMVG